MKRDMDLVRKILMVCEDHEEARAPQDLEIDGYTKEPIGYHALLMDEAELVIAHDVSRRGECMAKIVRLTWAGHEFLAAARDDTIWQRAKAAVTGTAFEALRNVLVQYATTQGLKAMGA